MGTNSGTLPLRTEVRREARKQEKNKNLATIGLAEWPGKVQNKQKSGKGSRVGQESRLLKTRLNLLGLREDLGSEFAYKWDRCPGKQRAPVCWGEPCIGCSSIWRGC